MLVDLITSSPSRITLEGPEARLIRAFLGSYQPRLLPSETLSVFREPRIASGFPDLVLVLTRGQLARELKDRLSELAVLDLKILHLIHLMGPLPTAALAERHGRVVLESLKRLKKAELIEEDEEGWCARPLRSIFPAREIVAIEAKVSSWSAALRQAHLNTWFASRSYILLPENPKAPRFLEAAAAAGIGVIVQRDFPKVVLRAPKQPLPASYVSWQLAKWASEAAK